MGGMNSSKQKASSNSGMNAAFMPYAKAALNKAMAVGNQGYTPYMGTDVALPDALLDSWQGTANRNATFNTPGEAAPDIRAGMPLQTQNGVQGLSSYSGYQNQLEQLKANYPGLYKYIQSFAIDPVTGLPGENTLSGASLSTPSTGGPGLMSKFKWRPKSRQYADGNFINLEH